MFLPAPSPPPYSLPSSPPPAHAPTCLPSTHSSPTPTQYPARTCKAQENTTKMNSKIQSLETEMAAIKQTSSVERQESVMIVRALEASPPPTRKMNKMGRAAWMLPIGRNIDGNIGQGTINKTRVQNLLRRGNQPPIACPLIPVKSSTCWGR